MRAVTVGAGLLAGAVSIAVLAAAPTQGQVPLEDFEQPLGDRWSFHDGSEFPGAKGSFERASEAGHEGFGGRLSFDFTGGGAYVQATLKLPKEPALEAVELWVRKPVRNRMTVRAVDERGQTFQKSFSFAVRGWQRLRVRMDGWSFSYGGPGDGVFHGRPTAVGLLVERIDGGTTGAVELDDLVGIPRTEAGPMGVYEPEYVVATFAADEGWGFWADGPGGNTSREEGTIRYDFRQGATTVQLGHDLSLLGRPQSLSLKLRSDGSGHEVTMSLYSHFQHFHRTLGKLEATGEMTLTAPLGAMDEWEHSGGEDDGVARMPLRVGRIQVVPSDGGRPNGEVVLEGLSVRTEVAPRQALFPLARIAEGEAGVACELETRSLAPEALEASVTARICDFAGRVLDESQHDLALPTGAKPARITIPVSETELPFVEAQVTVAAPGQSPKAVSAVRVAPWEDEGSRELSPGSHWGMGLYLYRYPGSADGLRAMDRAAALAQAAGVKWSREEFLWQRIEPREGEFDWSFYDQVVETAQRHGISIYGLIDYWSPWTEAYTEQGVEGYCRYAQALVDHYQDRIKHWEIWNEPNIFFWSGPKELYFTLLDKAYAAIKEVDPEAVVFGCSTAGIDTNFIRRTMEAGARFDGLTIHPYRGALDDAQFVKELRDVAAMVDGRPVWITEMGWPTQIGGVSEREQASLLARCYLAAVASGAVGNVSWYDFREDGSNPYYNEHHFGIIRNDFGLKPAYRAAATVCRSLAGLQAIGFEEWSEGIVACRFVGGEGETLAVWSVPGGAMLKLEPVPEGLSVRNLMGEAVTPLREAEAAWVHLPPGTPVFIRSAQPGLRGEASPFALVLDEPGVQPGQAVSVKLEAGALGLNAAEVEWQLPVGWVIEGEGLERRLRVPQEASEGQYEIAALVRAGGAQLVLPATVEVVPEVIEV